MASSSPSNETEVAMIHGIIMDVKGEELIERISVRASHHKKRAKECGVQLRKLGGIGRTRAKNLDSAVLGAMEPDRQTLQRKARQHQERADALIFLGKHIVRDEVYRVTESDLRVADLLPDRTALGDWLW